MTEAIKIMIDDFTYWNKPNNAGAITNRIVNILEILRLKN